MSEEVIIGLGNAYIGSGGGMTPTGDIDITENGTYDVTDYATATVGVPGVVPTGNIRFTANVEGFDVAQYATATVAVPSPLIVFDFDLNGAEGDAPIPMLAVKYGTRIEGDSTYYDTSAKAPRGELREGHLRWESTGYSTYAIPPDGTHFTGWSTERDANVGSFAFAFTEGATLYAIWTTDE